MNTTEKKLVNIERMIAAVLAVIAAFCIWCIFNGSLIAVAVAVFPAAGAAWLMEDASKIKANAKQRENLKRMVKS